MKVFLQSIGCRLNQAEIEKYAAQFRQLGYEITDKLEEADFVVVNTCSVTAAAASDSRGKIRLAGQAPHTKVIVTGCWSEMDPVSAMQLPGVLRVVPNQAKDRLVADFSVDTPMGDISDGQSFSAAELVQPENYENRTRTRAFIKVQDGCDNFCSYCVTRLARGKARSMPFSQILTDVAAVRAAGAQEIVLTGVNLGAWGLDFTPQQNLTALLSLLLVQTDLPRIRLSSLESWNLDESFIRLWENPRLCPHLHLPLQSASPEILKRMFRRTKLTDLLNLVQRAREVNPDFSITTDVIVGFPGETAAEFAETCEFVRTAGFSGGHVFTFSERPGTAAVKLEGKVEKALMKERSALLRAQFEAQTYQFLERQVGKTTEVLWESAKSMTDGRFLLKGHSENFCPLQAEATADLRNQISAVHVDRCDGKNLRGTILR